MYTKAKSIHQIFIGWASETLIIVRAATGLTVIIAGFIKID